VDYSNLSLHILQIFAEAQQPVSALRLSESARIWSARRSEHNERMRVARARLRVPKPPPPPPPPRVERVPYVRPTFQPELGRLPALVSCVKCRQGLTTDNPRAIQSHVQNCGVRHHPVHEGIGHR